MPNDQDENGKFEGRTHLFIRTNPADTGAEPLPSTLQYWISPDIVVIKPDGTRGTEAVADQQNHVEVTITNTGGINAVDAFVDVFVAAPSTAFPPPALATPVYTSPDGKHGKFLTILGYSMRSITFPWTPILANAGHRCLLARVALYSPLDVYDDGTTFDVVGDRHVAQLNIHVVDMGQGNAIRFGFAIVNVFEKPMSMRLVPRELREPLQQRQIANAVGCDFVQFGETPLKNYKVDVGAERVVMPKVQDPREIDDPNRPRLRGTGPLSRVGLTHPRARLSLEMEAREMCQGLLYVERNPDTRPGDVHAIDVAQVAEDGTIVGGLTVIVRH
jgi:hypothetical protein